MFPPVFSIAAANAGVTAVFGSAPTRIYPFVEAPQASARPYAVWQSVAIVPENYVGTVPDIDSMACQIDVYAESAAQARSGAQAIRDALQTSAHVTAMREFPREADTNLYRYQLDVDFWVER